VRGCWNKQREFSWPSEAQLLTFGVSSVAGGAGGKAGCWETGGSGIRVTGFKMGRGISSVGVVSWRSESQSEMSHPEKWGGAEP
jgi:hypothetical protein